MSIENSSQRFGSECPRFTPPQSAQPHQSIFGGPSSQNVDLDLEPYTQVEREGEVWDGDDQDDFLDEIPLPPFADDDSDDPDYDETDAAVTSAGEEGFNVTDAEGKKKGKEVIRDDSITQIPPSSPPQHRPNRHHGPVSTWRYWTEQERQVAEGLDEIRARDLSAHLFNAFALKRRAREMRERALEDEDHWEEIFGVRARTAAFVPPKRWTAWPMAASEVPRAGEQVIGDEEDVWTLRRPPDPRPSADLEESLIAIMMKTAKEQFWQREWVPEERRRKQTTQKEDGGETTEDEPEWKTEQGLRNMTEYRPVVQTDDDKSRQQLRPLVRNILTRFDRLLMGLHHARKASIAPEDSSETESDEESIPSRSSSSTRKRRLTSTSGRSRSRGRKRVRTTSPTESAMGESSDANYEESHNPEDSESAYSSPSLRQSHSSPQRSRSNHRSQSRPRHAKTALRFGLRDWSDVLGIAAMIGCPSPAVMRAAQRCADLFGEDMIFRTLEEGRVQRIKSNTDKDETNASDWIYTEDLEGDKEVQKPPRPALPRRSRSGPRSRRSSTSRKREASVAAADVVAAKEDDDEPELLPAPGRRQKGKGKHRKQDLICPVVGCLRHTDGFTRTWNLNLHMKRVHPGYVKEDDREQHADAPVEGEM
jgi:hypothetical protein